MIYHYGMRPVSAASLCCRELLLCVGTGRLAFLVCLCVCMCKSCDFKQVWRHTHISVCVHVCTALLARLSHVTASAAVQAGLGYPKCLLVFQCPVSNTLKSNCQFVCMCVCMYAFSPPRQLAAASMPTHTLQCYLCIFSAMRLNPFTSNLNLRARYTPSRSMPYALHSQILHTHRHYSPCYP